MLALPAHGRRRKFPTPIKQPDREDVWCRSLYVLGLEPITAKSNSSSSSSSFTMASPAIPTAPAIPVAGSAKLPNEPKTFQSLSTEIQKEIFSHTSSSDLISLSLVSRHFRDLAAEQIYRTFRILLPDDDGHPEDNLFDGLAGGLETFVASEYDYAQYLKEIALETQSGGRKGERAYRRYLYAVSCGKFMNTLLLLTLRKAQALETFRWDIRVELSRPVFKALHQIQVLQHLHLRMQEGPSIYQPLTALPTSVLPPMHGAQVPLGSSVTPLPPILPVPAGSPNSFHFGNKIAKICQKPPIKAHTAVRPPPPTLSGFKNLKTLTILDMDMLQYVDELRTCISNSSATLRNLTLSFSEALVARSREPQPDSQSDDETDLDDDYGQSLPPPGPPPIDPASAAFDSKYAYGIPAYTASGWKKMQESALGRILGVETIPPKPKPVIPKSVVVKPKVEEDPKRRFIRNLAPVAAKLMSHVKPGSDISIEGLKTLEMIEEAARQYLASGEKEKDKDESPAPGAESTTNSTPVSSSASGEEGASALMSGAVVPTDPGLFDAPEKKKSADDESQAANPEDINIEEPEAQELLVEFDVPSTEVVPNDDMLAVSASDEPSESPESMKETTGDFTGSENGTLDSATPPVSTELQQTMEQIKGSQNEECDDSHDTGLSPEGNATPDQMKCKLASLAQGNATPLARTRRTTTETAESRHSQMSEYVRKTRGLTLESLSIYLMPVKASVISRCIDLNVLQSITLLNVGPQAPFWNMVAKENLVMPLPLHKIHTDNVTIPLLLCLCSLDNVTELILRELVTKDRGESTAAKTTVTVENIRKIVLKKHASNLKVLVIRNDTPSSEWDLNIRTIMLLCRRAKKLQELGCTFASPAMHTLLQYMSGLSSLRVFHTIHFRNDDNCTWVMKEFRKFAVDAIAHNPDMKLEYLALDTSVDRLVRRKPMPKPKVEKGKGKEMNWTSAKALAELVMGSNTGTWGDASKYDFPDSEDDEEDGEGGIVKTGLRVETVDGVSFSDVYGVRIFERDVITGKL